MRPTLQELIERTLSIKDVLEVKSFELRYFDDGCYVDFFPRIIKDVEGLATITAGLDVKILTNEQKLTVRVFEQEF